MLTYEQVILELKAKGQSIGELASFDVESAKKVIKQYAFHYAAPGDPGGQAFLITAYEEFQKDHEENYLSPSDGGCWFCQRKDKQEDMEFDTEFDTYVHLNCLKKVLKKIHDHPEANIMKYLIKEKTDPLPDTDN